jgi:aldehyde:ferredoxin oxidoreductase
MSTARQEGKPGAIAGAILRVDLSSGRIWNDTLSPEDWRKYMGGAGLGAKILWDEVPPEVNWDDPENRLVLATGPLAGTPVWGTGGLNVCTRGALTNGATSTQANGFFGANLKFSGFDAIVLQGQSEKWVYLHIQDGQAELRDATGLLGLDTWETQQKLEEELGYRGHQLSVYTSGVAGENRVRFAAIHGDYGHVASKNGCGAVMGVKRCKAVAIVRGNRGVAVHDPAGLLKAADQISHSLRTNPTTQGLYELGTLPGVVNLSRLGALPMKNYTTNVWPEGVDVGKWEGSGLRAGFDHRGHQCNACGMHHCHMQVVAEGPHKGELVDEPEYEGWSGCGWAIGCTDPQAVSWLNTQVDRACVDVNEFGWLVGWVMECYEKGYITREQLGGIDLQWGDAEAANALLQMIIRREGFGDVLAEGVKRAAEHLGGAAQECAIYTEKGNTPRGHDHRGRWEEMLDTCVGSGGTLETGPPIEPGELDRPAHINPFDGDEVAHHVSKLMGRRHFEDSLGICNFTSRARLAYVCEALNAATGWDFDLNEAQRFGRRVAALLRAFNVRCGIGPETERPSKRYGSQPVDGPAAEYDIKPHFERMKGIYYDNLGYDRATGKPTAELLEQMGLEHVAKALWS